MTEAVRRYHSVAMTLHWLIAVLILANLAMGISFGFIPRGAEKVWLYQLHKSIGIVVLFLTCIRIAWRLGAGAPKEPPMPAWQQVVSAIVHFLMYFLMIAIPFTGWAMVSYSPLNIPTYLFWTIPFPHLPSFDPSADMSPEALKATSHQIAEVHKYLAYSMIGLWVVHVGAALQHHFMLKDTVLFRMTPKFLEKPLRFLRGERG